MTKLLLMLGAVVAANLNDAVVQPAAAQRPVVVIAKPEPAATRRVSYADLDLATRDGERMLIRRLRAAVNDVCAEEVGPSAIFYVKNSCRKLTWSDAELQLDRAINHSRQLAASSTPFIAAAVIVVRAAQ